MPTRVRPWVYLALASASIALMYGAVGLAPVAVEMARGEFLTEQHQEGQPFDNSGWQSRRASWDGTRQAMVKDLLATHPFLGMPEGLVLELLGTLNIAPWGAPSTMFYRLGPEQGAFSVDDEWLVLRMEDGKVANVSIERD